LVHRRSRVDQCEPGVSLTVSSRGLERRHQDWARVSSEQVFIPLGIWLGGAALTLGVHRLSFVPSGPASSSSLLQVCCPSSTTPLLVGSRLTP
jgi:hypothetical protein